MKDDENDFLIEVQEAIALGDAGGLTDAVSDFSEFCFKETPPASDDAGFSDEFLEELMKLMGDSTFLEMTDSFKLLALFQNDWGRLGSGQRTELLKFLATVFENLKDDTSHLVIAELLGEYSADEEGLQALDRLRGTKNEVARAHVAHGYKCLARNAADEGLRKTAKARLSAMATDSSEVVRQEVAAGLADLSR